MSHLSSSPSSCLSSNNTTDNDFVPIDKSFDDLDITTEDSNSFDMAEEIVKVRASVFAKPDLILIVEDTKLYLSKDQLVNISPVFEKMFPVVSGNDNHMTEKAFPGKYLKPFVDFLRCSMPGFDEGVADETISSVMKLAAEYQVKFTLAKVDMFLASKGKLLGDLISSEQVVDNILQAEEFNLTKFLETCIEIAARKYYSQIMENPKFQNVSIDTKFIISKKHWKGVDGIMQSNGCLDDDVRSVDFNQPYSSGFEELRPPPDTGSSLVERFKEYMHNN